MSYLNMNEIPMTTNDDQASFEHPHVRATGSDHRATCHRCGNVRKLAYECTECPHVFCKGCLVKMEAEYGDDCFVYGCPVVSNYISISLFIKSITIIIII